MKFNDTVEGFKCNPVLVAVAFNATTPPGYKRSFFNLNASVSAPSYMGLQTLKSYNTLTYQFYCDQASGCVAFNVELFLLPYNTPLTASPAIPSAIQPSIRTQQTAPTHPAQRTSNAPSGASPSATPKPQTLANFAPPSKLPSPPQKATSNKHLPRFPAPTDLRSSVALSMHRSMLGATTRIWDISTIPSRGIRVTIH